MTEGFFRAKLRQTALKGKAIIPKIRVLSICVPMLGYSFLVILFSIAFIKFI